MQLEDLLNKKKLYEGIKEILEKVINSFSSINFNDDLLSAKQALDSYFEIDEEALYANKVTESMDKINNNIDRLKEVLIKVDEELKGINAEILLMETTGNI